jgi:uncharacterized membrane protein YedE/YeeE
LAGAVFGVGLAVAQMIDPRKVLGFLDVAGTWDASLLFVLGGAVVVAAIGFHFVLRRPAPLFDDRFHVSTLKAVDSRLVIGAAIFGIGWGLGGYCPGPAISSLGFGNAEALLIVPAMLAGAGLQRWQARQRGPAQEAAQPVTSAASRT